MATTAKPAAAGVGRPRRFDPTTEIEMIVRAATSLLAQSDFEDVSVVAILNETGLSTRSFYRHFGSKDELLCAMYEDNASKLARRVAERVAAAGTPRAGLEVWIDEHLALAYDPRRAQRVAMLGSSGARKATGYLAVERRAVAGLVEPLRRVLERGRDDGTLPLAMPERDARSIHAITWDVLRGALGPTRLPLGEARAQVLRFALAGLGVPITG